MGPPPPSPRMGLKWGLRRSDTRKLEPFWGHKGHFLDPFWTHFIARYAIFPNKKCPQHGLFWSFLAPFLALAGHKNQFFWRFFVIFWWVSSSVTKIFSIFWRFFEIFLRFFGHLSPFFQHFRFLGLFSTFRDVKLAKTISLAIRGVMGWNFAGK